MPHNRQKTSPYLHTIKILYLTTLILSFYLLFKSRSEEVYTVWQALHPAFIPTLLTTTLLLLTLILSPEKTRHKLIYIIPYSILVNSFFIIIFPAGNLGPQQMILGRTRLVFNNVPNGWPPKTENPLTQIFNWFRGIGYQASISVILARMLSIDVYWTHLPLGPIVWGTFVPLTVFLITKEITNNENTAILSSLLTFVFPLNIVWGSVSLPHSLAYLFFLCSLLYTLKYLSSGKPNLTTTFLTLFFSFISFLTHFLAGIISFCLLLLAIAHKKHQNEKTENPITSKLLLLTSFLFAALILPSALRYLRFFYPKYVHFSLRTLSEISSTEAIISLIFGKYATLHPITTIVYGTAPLIGLIGILYTLLKKPKTNKNPHTYTLFLFITLSVILLDYRILKFAMVNLPFKPERLWVFRDFILLPFLATFMCHILSLTQTKISKLSALPNIDLGFMITRTGLLTLLTTGTIISIYYAYPHYAPLQTTNYELEAVKYIDKTTTENYIVICDIWFTFAGQTIVGVSNPQAFYFPSTDPRGIKLYVEAKNNPTNETLTKAMEINNATTAYFVIEKPRLGEEEYNRIIQQAQQNGLKTYPGGIFHHKGEEKLRIFYYQAQNH